MISFSKYHGCGNNFVIVKEEDLADYMDIQPGEESSDDYGRFAEKVCNINIGIGADGLIVVRQNPALEMVFFNCDGSRAPMCGNGIRCFANYCYDKGINIEDSYTVKTLAGDMVVNVVCREPFRVKIDMGSPVFSPEAVKADYTGKDFINQKITLKDGSQVDIDSLFMGTIHTVVFTDDVDVSAVEPIGEEICNHEIFKEKTNVNFVKPIDDETLEMITYERGVGMTLACGTGACASVVAANMRGLCGNTAEVKLPLGSLKREIKANNHVYMEGPSVRISDGEFC